LVSGPVLAPQEPTPDSMDNFRRESGFLSNVHPKGTAASSGIYHDLFKSEGFIN